MNILCKLILIAPLLVAATGCASIARGTLDTLEVSSVPDQADIKIYRTNAGLTAKEIKENTVENLDNPGGGPIVGKTPASFELARKGEYRVLISKEGYKTTEVEVGNRYSGAGRAGMAGNILAGGIVGIIVDANTGASKDLTPNPITVTLELGEGTILVPLEIKESEDRESGEEETY
jgi:hypothetical protein